MPEHLYVIRTPGGARKVGHSRDPENRRRNLSTTGYVCELEYSAPCPDDRVRAVELHAHALLWAARTGGEYFAVNLDTAKAAVDAAILTASRGLPLEKPPRPADPGVMTRHNVLIPPEIVTAIDAFWRSKPMGTSYSAALRELIERGLRNPA